MDHGQGKSCETLASVTLPPLPPGAGTTTIFHHGAAAPPTRVPGGAVRLPPPSPPPRPTSTLVCRPPHPPPLLGSSSGGEVRGGGSGGGVSLQQSAILSTSASRTTTSSSSLSASSSPSAAAQQQANTTTATTTTAQSAHSFSSLVGGGTPRVIGGGSAAAQLDLLSSSTPLAAATAVSTQNITLFTPRTVRQQNVYVDTPIKKSSDPQQSPPSIFPPSTPINSMKRVGQQHHRPATIMGSGGNGHGVVSNNKSLPTVINQPIAGIGGIGACKPAVPGSLNTPGGGGNNTSAANDSIICYECGKCRCATCRVARPLPSTWVCDNKCLVSVESCVDTLTCMCCVKAGLYHCGELVARGEGDTREQDWVDHPCSCSSNNWLVRWGCLCGLSMVLPCLLCYPLLKGGSMLAERAYQASTRHGCTCSHQHRSWPSSSPGDSGPQTAPGGNGRHHLHHHQVTPETPSLPGGGVDSTPTSSPSASEDKRLLS